MVGVGAHPQSKVYYEFRVYSSDSRRIINTIYRTDKMYLSSMILEVNNHPLDEEKLLIMTKEGGTTYTVVEINVENSHAREVCQVIGYDIELFKVSEDISTIFVAKFERKKNSFQGFYKLYALDYGVDYNFTENLDTEPIGELGVSIIKHQIIGNTILVLYSLVDQTEKIEIFSKNYSEVVE
jgi:hypothetical protein